MAEVMSAFAHCCISRIPCIACHAIGICHLLCKSEWTCWTRRLAGMKGVMQELVKGPNDWFGVGEEGIKPRQGIPSFTPSVNGSAISQAWLLEKANDLQQCTLQLLPSQVSSHLSFDVRGKESETQWVNISAQSKTKYLFRVYYESSGEEKVSPYMEVCLK